MSAALIAKLESASEGSRELDFWIAYDLGLMADIVPVRPANVREGHGEVCLLDASGKSLGWVGYHVSKPVTTSIDAALALAERVLGAGEDEPVFWEFGFNAVISGQRQYSAMFSPPWDSPGDNYGHAATPALAICAALLRASAAKGAGHE